jgi:hypothetical protein
VSDARSFTAGYRAGAENAHAIEKRYIADTDALRDALRAACWHLACNTFQGKDTSVGQEADRLERLFLDDPDAAP